MNVKITWIVVLSALLFASCVSTPKEPPTTEYTVVLEFPEKTANQLYDMTKMWLNEVFNDPNAVQSYSDGTETISGKFEHKISYTMGGLFGGTNTTKTRSTINIRLKDGKVLFNMKQLQWLYVPPENAGFNIEFEGQTKEIRPDPPEWRDVEETDPEVLRSMNYESIATGYANKLQKFIDSFGAGVDF